MNQIEQTIQQYNPVRTTWDDFYDIHKITGSSYDSMYSSILDSQKHIEEREDSAYQRMVEDMRKAGLNPWTGISTGGSSTSQNNASSDALAGLMTGLEYNLKVRDNTYKQDKLMTDTLTKVLGFFYSIAKSFS